MNISWWFILLFCHRPGPWNLCNHCHHLVLVYTGDRKKIICWLGVWWHVFLVIGDMGPWWLVTWVLFVLGDWWHEFLVIGDMGCVFGDMGSLCSWWLVTLTLFLVDLSPVIGRRSFVSENPSRIPTRLQRGTCTCKIKVCVQFGHYLVHFWPTKMIVQDKFGPLHQIRYVVHFWPTKKRRLGALYLSLWVILAQVAVPNLENDGLFHRLCVSDLWRRFKSFCK